MADIIIRGSVDEHGKLILEQDTVDLPPGPVEIRIHPKPKTYSVTIEEAKRLMAEQPELTDEEWEEVAKVYDADKAIIEDTGLPEDYADEIDHYLYGTPKRKQDKS